MGNAFLTQTATQSDKERVVFHHPVKDMDKKAPRPVLVLSPTPAVPTHAPGKSQISNIKYQISNLKSQLSSDFLAFLPDPEAQKTVSYSYGRDGVKWTANDSLPQVYMMDADRRSQISLLGAAPTEVDIPLGVYVPDTRDFTFSLPEKEAFKDYRYVWLIDYEQNRYTNLLFENYTVPLEIGRHNRRFAIRIGEFPKTDNAGERRYVVYAYEGTLFVRGLIPGDKIDIYTSAGQLVFTTHADGYEFSQPLMMQSGYIVKINDRSHKIVNI
jgi:hypothetical protein